MSPSAGKKFSGWWLGKVRDNAKSHLGQGETIEAATYGQEAGSPVAALACFWRPRLIATTQTHVYVFEGGILNSAKVGKLISKHERGQVAVKRSGRKLTVGELTIWPPPGSKPETMQLVELATRGAPTGAGREPAPAAPAAPPDTSVPPPTS
jgi:hypothetical protein